MKRSEINKAINGALEMFREYKIALPDFVNWTPEEWATKGEETLEIRENMLGWDVTDYGGGEFDKLGLLLITIRNGNQKNPKKYPKPYAEKLMIVKEEQITPMHFHWSKMEDIINRGGGNLMIKLYNSTKEEELDATDVEVSIDGVKHVFPAGHVVKLTPGQSITLTQGLYHRFWGEKGCGTVLVAEVSMCNDDNTDNRFYDKVGRFPKIEEDEKPIRLLCNEYDTLNK
jgi:D-lyxose ketol-isomerase